MAQVSNRRSPPFPKYSGNVLCKQTTLYCNPEWKRNGKEFGIVARQAGRVSFMRKPFFRL